MLVEFLVGIFLELDQRLLVARFQFVARILIGDFLVDDLVKCLVVNLSQAFRALWLRQAGEVAHHGRRHLLHDLLLEDRLAVDQRAR